MSTDTLRDKIAAALTAHTLTEANGGRPSRIGLDLLPPADRARIEANARSRADALIPVIAAELDARWEQGRKHGLRQARAPQRGRERQLEDEIESMLAAEEANSAAWLAKCARVRELEDQVRALLTVLDDVSCAGSIDEVSDALDGARPLVEEIDATVTATDNKDTGRG